MTLPARFLGAWLRTEMLVDGGAVENAPTMWLEAGAAFVDVRAPGGVASDMTFAGTTSWSEPHLTWTHEIDSAESDADVGLITPDGDDFVESGSFTLDDREITFAERWTPQPGATGGPVLAADLTDGADRGLAVRVGDHASVVVDRRAGGGVIAACYRALVDGAWVERITHGPADAVAALPRPLGPAALPAGWTWRT